MDSLMLSNVFNYQAVFGNVFSRFLRNEKTSSSTERIYHADVRHFLTWLAIHQDVRPQKPMEPYEWLRDCSDNTINAYIETMRETTTTTATINRRLSALRLFFSCAIQEGWITENPMLTIQNIKTNETISFEKEFLQFLVMRNASEKTKTNYAMDIRHFLSWTKKQIEFSRNIDQSDNPEIISRISASTITQYKQALLDGKTPIATINRRLSAIRLFLAFSVSKKWISSNPADSIKNVTEEERVPFSVRLSNILSEYEADTSVKSAIPLNARAVITDFFLWTDRGKSAV